jgi:23S rRNA (adenine2503-C2)-methyltransferase
MARSHRTGDRPRLPPYAGDRAHPLRRDRDALAAILADEPRYRVDQVWDGLYRRLASPFELTVLPLALRARLDHELPTALSGVTESVDGPGATVKWLFGLDGGAHIETVLMHYRDRTTVCISTQAGCAMASGFCATGQSGFERHLTTGEIVEQIVRAAHRARDGGRRLGNVVFMGMGEALANYDQVWPAVERAHGALGCRPATSRCRPWASYLGSAGWRGRTCR